MATKQKKWSRWPSDRVIGRHPDIKYLNSRLNLLSKLQKASHQADGFTFIGNNTLGQQSGISGRTIQRGLTALQKAGLILTVYGYGEADDAGEQSTVRCIIPVGSRFVIGFRNALKHLHHALWFGCRSPKTNKNAAFEAAWTALCVQSQLFPGHQQKEASQALFEEAPHFFREDKRIETDSFRFWDELSKNMCPWAMDNSVVLSLDGSSRASSRLSNYKTTISESKKKASAPPETQFRDSDQESATQPPCPGSINELISTLEHLLPAHPYSEWPKKDFQKVLSLLGNPAYVEIFKFVAENASLEIRQNALIQDITSIRKLRSFAKPIVAPWRNKHIKHHDDFRYACLMPTYRQLFELWDQRLNAARSTEDIASFNPNSVPDNDFHLPGQVLSYIAHHFAAIEKGISLLPLSTQSSNRLLARFIRTPSVWRHLLHPSCQIRPDLFFRLFGFTRDTLKTGVVCSIEALARDADQIQKFRFLDAVIVDGYIIDFGNVPDPETYRRINPELIDVENDPGLQRQPELSRPQESEAANELKRAR